MVDESNPWLVNNLDDFLYYCCPECGLKDKSKEIFLQHALEAHPNAKKSLSKKTKLVKHEPFDDDEVLGMDPGFRMKNPSSAPWFVGVGSQQDKWHKLERLHHACHA